MSDYKKIIPAVLLFNFGLFYIGWFSSSEETQELRNFAIEGSKAIAWMISAPVCEVNGFCLKIEEDSSAGSFVSSTLRKEANIIHGDFTQIETTLGTYVVKGKVEVAKIPKQALVTLHEQKGGLKNVLCIDSTNCFLVPFNKHE